MFAAHSCNHRNRSAPARVAFRAENANIIPQRRILRYQLDHTVTARFALSTNQEDRGRKMDDPRHVRRCDRGRTYFRTTRLPARAARSSTAFRTQQEKSFLPPTLHPEYPQGDPVIVT